MRHLGAVCLFVISLTAILFGGCGDRVSSRRQCVPSSAPTPVLSSLSPSSATQLGPGFTLELRGSGFTPASIVKFNSSYQFGTTTFVSSSQLTIPVPAIALTLIGDLPIQVFNASGCSSGPDLGSNTLTFAVTPAPPGVIGLISVAPDGSPGLGGDSERSSVGWGGRSVAFDSRADNLVPNDTNSSSDIFLRDTCIGASDPCTPSTTLVSVGMDGSPANGDSTNPNGVRFVVFQSSADNLVEGDTNGAVDVFLRDTCIGAVGSCTPSTIRLSLASDGSQGNGDSVNPVVSADGQYVVFQSLSTNLTANDTNGAWDIFVRRTCIGFESGCQPSTTPVSVAMGGGMGNGLSVNPSMDFTGGYIAFQSAATNLAANDTNGSVDIFVREMCVQPIPGCTILTTRISVASDGMQSNNDSADPFISEYGRFVAFASLASNLVAGDTNSRWDVFVRDTCRTAPSGCVPSTTRVSLASDGSESEGDVSDVGIRPSIGLSGRYVAFSSSAANLVAGDMNSSPDVFVRDTCRSNYIVPSDCQPSTRRVSVASGGEEANAGSVLPSISADGGFIVFKSASTNLVANDTNGLADVYLSVY